MRSKSLLILCISLGCGLISTIGLSELMENRRWRTPPAETASLLVAQVDIERSSELSRDVIAIEEWPKDRIPEGALTSLEDIEGRRAVIEINRGLPILQSMLGSTAAASEEIPDGLRVVAVRVTEESGAGLIKPGDRVDVQVYATQSESLGIERTGIWTFLQDVSVFAVGSVFRSEEGNDGPMEARTISLIASPKQAAKVTLASQMGRIRLVMRNGKDTQAVAGGAEANPSEIFGGKPEQVVAPRPEPKPPAPTRSTFKTAIFRGVQAEIHEFEDGFILPRRVTASEPFKATPQADPTSGDGSHDSSDENIDSRPKS